MDNIRDLIEETLKSNDIGINNKNSILEALERIFIYHEEIRFQNDELKRVNTMVEKLQLDYESLFKEAPLPYYLLDKNFIITKVNHAGNKLLSDANILGRSFFEFIRPEFQDVVYYLKRKMIQGENYSDDIDLQVFGEIKHVQLFFNVVQRSDEEFYRLSLVDQTLLRKKIDEIKYLSYHDQLTGVFNRHYLLEEVSKLDHPNHYPIGVIMTDLNGLKLVNDSFGHDVGDQLLIKACRVLESELGAHDIIARTGGDEFVIITPNTTEQEVKKKIKQMQASSDNIGIKDLKLSMAYGYSIKKSTAQSLTDILKAAEDIMYKDKMFNRTSQRKNVINSIIATLHEKHPREEEHSNRVSQYAIMLARALDLPSDKILNIKMAGILHDIGKVAIDYSILDKSEPLTVMEFEEIRKHPSIGFRILSSAEVFGDIAEIVLTHHERVDGHGYPRKLKSDAISIEAKILYVCDAYDAMTSDRPYRKTLTKEEAIQELIHGKGSQFDAKLVDAFVKCLEADIKPSTYYSSLQND